MKTLQWFFRFLSLLFHPWLILSYSVLLLWLVNPYIFLGGQSDMGLLVIKIWISSFLFPALIAAMMIGLKFVDVSKLHHHKERIFPLIGSMLFYIWLSVNMYLSGGTPDALLVLTLGATLALIMGFVINIAFPISFHALGMGVLVAASTLFYFFYGFTDFSLPGSPYLIGTEWLVIFTLLLSGWILTARKWLRSYDLKQLYASWIIGIFMPWLVLFNLTFIL